MEQTQIANIEKTGNLPELTKYLTTLTSNLDRDEAELARVKYKSERFEKMDDATLSKWALAIVLKIHTITGWVVPEDRMRGVLVDQFKKKIMESYATCNPDEVEYAFRTYGTKVKDWGKQMNLSLIDEVMSPYLDRRYDLSKHEEILDIYNSSKQIEYKEDMSMEAMQDWFNATAKKIKAGELRIEFVPPMLYEWMDSNGNISATKEQKYEYLNRAVEYRLGVLRDNLEKADTATNRFALSTFITMKNNGCMEGSEVSIVKTLAKQILLFEMILNSEMVY